MSPLRLALIAALAVVTFVPAQQPMPIPPPPTPWSMFGGTPGRNMVNLVDRNVLDVIDATKGLPLRWKADLGNNCYGQPVVAGGRVYIGTNNERPRNKRDTAINADKEVEGADKSCLYCFDERTGQLLWQAVHDKLDGGLVRDWPRIGFCSIPTVEGDRVYYVSNQCRVVCLDANGFADGNQGFPKEKYTDPTDADVLWEYDMIKELKVFPHNQAIGCPLIVGDRLFVPTGNGVDEGHINLPSPDAPSFICLDKRTGKLLWKDNSPGKNIMHGQWAQPAYAAEPVPQVIVPAGDGWLRAFDPENGKLIWKFDCNPKGTKHELGGLGDKSDFIAAPVVVDDRVTIGVGQDPEHFTGIGHLWCIDLKKAVTFGAVNAENDVTPLGNNFDPAAAVNKSSALAWHYGGEAARKFVPRDFKFGRTMSTVAIVDGIVYAAELQGLLHCLNAKTGEHYWLYDCKGSIWSAPYYVDGKVLLGIENGDLFVFRHDPRPEKIDPFEVTATDERDYRQKSRAKMKQVENRYLKSKIEFDAQIRGTPSVANGVLYLATDTTLYAIKKTKE